MANKNAPVTIAPDLVLEYDGHQTTVGQLPEASLIYLLRYGWSQTIQDAGAGRSGLDAADARNKRTAAILAGTMVYAARGRRSAADLMERALHDAATYYIDREATARGTRVMRKNLPELVATWLADEANLAKARRRVDALAAID